MQPESTATLTLLDVVRRNQPPIAWAEGEKIPWDDPEFSRRILAEHLSQHHDAASRRSEIIDRHVQWIHDTVLAGRSTRILDLACGPGLYTSRLARRGHTCVGIDFAPASIDYALGTAQAEGLRCTYLRQDMRRATFGSGYGLVMFVFGEFNVFRPVDAELILRKAHSALADGGILLLEPHTWEGVRKIGATRPIWYAAEWGLFSDTPHLCLAEAFWDPDRRVATERYFIIDARSGTVTRHAASTQAYTDDEYESLLTRCGFTDVTFHPSLSGNDHDRDDRFCVIVARKDDATEKTKKMERK